MRVVDRILLKEIVRPLRTTFSTSLGQKDVMKSVIVQIRLKDGLTGTGECPTSFAVKDETVAAIKCIIRDVSPQLKGLPIEAYGEKIGEFRRRFPQYPMTISGLEVALFRAYLASAGRTEHAYFGGKLDVLETDITIPYTTDINTIETWIEYAVRKGFTTYKFKVSGRLRDDANLISEVYRRLRDKMRAFTVRLDGNQGFTEKTCLDFFDFLVRNAYPVELFEQPLRKDDYRGLRQIKKRSPVPIILDETVFTVTDLERAVEDNLCHGINIKIAKSGIDESLKLYKAAKKHGLKRMIGCMTETMVGLSAGIDFAAGKGGFDYIDLDAVHFLYHCNTYGPMRIVGKSYILSGG
ncbi:MAG TPA: enolase C-terminal domain-like protein [Syntrophorhabdaceae bacterium]|nr:enolase C-terminal domain-like protein [Syntrophorhabdaceae bacterium]